MFSYCKVYIVIASQLSTCGTTMQAMVLDFRAAYVITGGSGGLGLLFASWMGARCVILLGRSGRVASPHVLAPLAASDAQIVVMRTDVSRGEEAAAAAAAAAAVGRPLAGVIHAAGVQVLSWTVSIIRPPVCEIDQSKLVV